MVVVVVAIRAAVLAAVRPVVAMRVARAAAAGAILVVVRAARAVLVVVIRAPAAVAMIVAVHAAVAAAQAASAVAMIAAVRAAAMCELANRGRRIVTKRHADATAVATIRIGPIHRAATLLDMTNAMRARRWCAVRANEASMASAQCASS